MRDYLSFDITDFVLDEDFIRWVYEKNAADTTFWHQWLDEHPEKLLMIAEARRIVESVKTAEKPVSRKEIHREVTRLRNTIQAQTTQELLARRRVLTSRWRMAAAILLLTGSGTIFFLSRQQQAKEKITATFPAADRLLVEKSNATQKPLGLTLPDSSRVTLSPGSRIAYAHNFNVAGTRDLYLSGEAFFEVTRDPRLPFRVFANNVVAKVLGTSFIIRSFDADATIQVTVKTGKVSVYATNTETTDTETNDGLTEEIIVTSNQQLVYKKTAQQFRKSLLENPVITTAGLTDNSMVYDDVPVVTVFTQLAKMYDINIMYDNGMLQHCTVTADLKHETFYRRLDLICKAVGARYEVIDGQVLILGSGCK